MMFAGDLVRCDMAREEEEEDLETWRVVFASHWRSAEQRQNTCLVPPMKQKPPYILWLLNYLQLSRKDRVHVYSCMWTLDKPTASLSAAICALAWIAIVLNLVKTFKYLGSLFASEGDSEAGVNNRMDEVHEVEGTCPCN